MEVARRFIANINKPKGLIEHPWHRSECDAMALVVLAASEVCSHRDIEKVILDASLMDDIKALAAALEGR